MEIISFLINKLPSPWGVISFIVIVFLIFHYINLKTNSSYNFVGRIWNIFIGSKKFNDVSIQKFHDDVQDVDQFNFRYNTKAKTKSEIAAFKKWISDNNYNIREISRIGSYFDIEKLEVKKTNRFATFGLFLLLVIAIPLNVLFYTPALSFGAITTLPDSNKFFIMSTDRAMSLGANFSIHKDDCDFKKISKPQLLHLSELNDNELSNICESFNDEAFKRVITSLKHIELAFSFLGCALSLFLFVIFRTIAKRINASNFISRNGL